MSIRQFRLGDEDRARLGCEEWITGLDPGTITAREAALIQHQTPYRGPDEFRTALRGVLAVDRDGGPVYITTGDGKRIQELDVDFEAQRVAVWLALLRTGLKLAYRDCDFAVYLIEPRDLPDDTDPRTDAEGVEDASGKDDGSTPPTT